MEKSKKGDCPYADVDCLRGRIVFRLPYLSRKQIKKYAGGNMCNCIEAAINDGNVDRKQCSKPGEDKFTNFYFIKSLRIKYCPWCGEKLDPGPELTFNQLYGKT